MEDEAGNSARIEIVIATETVRLSVDGPVSAEALAALTDVVNGLRSGRDPARVMAPAGDRGASPQGALARTSEPKSVAGGKGEPRVGILGRVPQAATATFRVLRDVVTDLIARLLGHALGFPP